MENFEKLSDLELDDKELQETDGGRISDFIMLYGINWYELIVDIIT